MSPRNRIPAQMSQNDQKRVAKLREQERKKVAKFLAKSHKKWCVEETELFYKRLSQYSTDFQRIATTMNRAREEVVNKYYTEKEKDPQKVLRALCVKIPIEPNPVPFLPSKKEKLSKQEKRKIRAAHCAARRLEITRNRPTYLTRVVYIPFEAGSPLQAFAFSPPPNHPDYDMATSVGPPPASPFHGSTSMPELSTQFSEQGEYYEVEMEASQSSPSTPRDDALGGALSRVDAQYEYMSRSSSPALIQGDWEIDDVFIQATKEGDEDDGGWDEDTTSQTDSETTVERQLIL